ncbi:hypothetical protein NIES2101_41040 [Calothrix sp. HK-06]|nr:hypothetical protein NIES2101_41040 [Calothrix sp. HK-06]
MKIDLCNINNVVLTQRQNLEPYTWVELKELPGVYSYDEALLLCQISNHEWIAWAPDHGEFVLCVWQIESV